MRRFHIAAMLVAAGAVALSLFGAPSLDLDQFADANTLRKVHFTQTVTSSDDPGLGGGDAQLTFILSPNPGTIYDGSMTFVASAPVSPMVLHALPAEERGAAEEAGLPTWTVDNRTVYAASVVGPGTDASSFEFTGAAVALLAESAGGFVATVSVDGWVRGAPITTPLQTIEVEPPADDPRLHLSRAAVPVTLPMHGGIYQGDDLTYVITDANDEEYAADLTELQGWRVEHAPALSGLPEAALQQVYVFKNGVEGDGIYGYQTEVFSSTPADTKYSALSEIVEVAWKPGQKRAVLESVDDILGAEEGGRLVLERPGGGDDGDGGVIINAQQIVWPGGEAEVRADAEPADGDAPYGGGQITAIDREGMTVTFVAHRGWGPDGKTIYHIVAGATPKRPADVMGVMPAPAYVSLINHSGASDLYTFVNGIMGSGSLGFQAEIAAAVPGDDAYTPIWRVHVVEWNDPGDAGVLENLSDIDAFRDSDMLTSSIARPTNSYYVLNAPIVDPFQ